MCDTCLFIFNNCIITLHTNGCCIFTINNAVIDALIASLKMDFLLEDQGLIFDYLGIHINQVVNPEINYVEV